MPPGLGDDVDATQREGPLADLDRQARERIQLRYPPRPDELEHEYRGYVRTLLDSPARVKELLDLGIDGHDIVTHHMVGLARVRVPDHDNPDKRWVPSEKGAEVFVTPVRRESQTGFPSDLEVTNPYMSNRDGPVRELVAWHPSRPDTYALRTGTELVLGSVLPQSLSMPMYHTPLEWLQASKRGSEGDYPQQGLVVLARTPAQKYEAFRTLTMHGALGDEARRVLASHSRPIEDEAPKQTRSRALRM